MAESKAFPDPAVFGGYVPLCDFGGAGFNWLHESDVSTLTVTHYEGCGAYQQVNTFNRTDWVSTTKVCNRCEHAQWVEWNTFERYYRNTEAPSIWGDGISGLVQFVDEHGRESNNQCDYLTVHRGGFDTGYPFGLHVVSKRLEPGESIESFVQFETSRFARDKPFVPPRLTPAPVMPATDCIHNNQFIESYYFEDVAEHPVMTLDAGDAPDWLSAPFELDLPPMIWQAATQDTYSNSDISFEE